MFGPRRGVYRPAVLTVWLVVSAYIMARGLRSAEPPAWLPSPRHRFRVLPDLKRDSHETLPYANSSVLLAFCLFILHPSGTPDQSWYRFLHNS